MTDLRRGWQRRRVSVPLALVRVFNFLSFFRLQATVAYGALCGFLGGYFWFGLRSTRPATPYRGPK